LQQWSDASQAELESLRAEAYAARRLAALEAVRAKSKSGQPGAAVTASVIGSTVEPGSVAPRPPSSTPEEDAREAALFDIKIFKKRAARPKKSSVAAWGSAFLAPPPPQAPSLVSPAAAVVISGATGSSAMVDDSTSAVVSEAAALPQDGPVDEDMMVDAEGATVA